MTTENKKIVVGFPLYQGVTLLDFAGATQVFAFSGDFKPVWIAQSLAAIKTCEGVSVNPAYSFTDHPQIDLLFVPGGIGAGVAHAMLDPDMQDFIKTASQSAQWSGSVCVGAFIIAAAGLLNQCRATTYWSLLDELNRFPDIEVGLKTYPRSVIEFKKKRFSGGGVSSSIDLALELVKIIKDKEIAELTDLSIQYAPEPPVKSGDPKQADNPRLVEKVRQNQKKIFIEPIANATTKVIGNM